MTSRATEKTVQDLYASLGLQPHTIWEEGVAHVEIHGNQILGAHLIAGFEIDARERDDGLEAEIRVARGTSIEKPIQICFGVLPASGVQNIRMRVTVEDGAQASVMAYCTFPNAVQVRHTMDADIAVGRDASYSYFERHVHGPAGGVDVVPKARLSLAEGAHFKTEFELIKGRVGVMDIDYDATLEARAVVDMLARIRGREDDVIRIREAAHLVGEAARGVLTSHIALKDTARADIVNELIAEAPQARGHVDCKEIVQDQAVARAVPMVEVRHPKAHVTHEAAIGSVDHKQLETLMAHGLDEDEASELIIQGLLSRD